jgi:hypothetical protein
LVGAGRSAAGLESLLGSGLASGLATGAVSRLGSGLASGLFSGRDAGLASGLLSGRATGLASGRVAGCASGLAAGLAAGWFSGRAVSAVGRDGLGLFSGGRAFSCGARFPSSGCATRCGSSAGRTSFGAAGVRGCAGVMAGLSGGRASRAGAAFSAGRRSAGGPACSRAAGGAGRLETNFASSLVRSWRTGTACIFRPLARSIAAVPGLALITVRLIIVLFMTIVVRRTGSRK